jgi:hypothetical protein
LVTLIAVFYERPLNGDLAEVAGEPAADIMGHILITLFEMSG